MIELDWVHKAPNSEGGAADAVTPKSLHIERRQIFGILGCGEDGRSALPTLINWFGAPGRLVLGGQEIAGLATARPRAARPSIGMVFQHFNLQDSRTLLANVSWPLESAGFPAAQARARATDCLKWVGLADRAHSYPRQLDSGQKRRAAIARALTLNPGILLCDEPTAVLDPQAADSVLSTLENANRDFGVTVVILTRSLEVVRRVCHAVAVVEHGEVVEQIQLADLLAAPRSELGRLLMGRPPRSPIVRQGRQELACA